MCRSLGWQLFNGRRRRRRRSRNVDAKLATSMNELRRRALNIVRAAVFHASPNHHHHHSRSHIYFLHITPPNTCVPPLLPGASSSPLPFTSPHIRGSFICWNSSSTPREALKSLILFRGKLGITDITELTNKPGNRRHLWEPITKHIWQGPVKKN